MAVHVRFESFEIFVHFFAVLCKTTALNDRVYVVWTTCTAMAFYLIFSCLSLELNAVITHIFSGLNRISDRCTEQIYTVAI